MLENITDLNHLTPNPAIGAVLVGLDLKMNYMKFAKAHLYLTANPNLPYLATNSDPTLPSTNYSFPGRCRLMSYYGCRLTTYPVSTRSWSTGSYAQHILEKQNSYNPWKAYEGSL